MKPQKTLAKILSGSRNVSFGDVVSLIEAYGFTLDRTSGSHRIFGRAGIQEQINLQPVQGQVKPYQLRQILKIIEKYDLKLGDDR